MKMKKLMALLLAAVMVLAMLAGCSNTGGNETKAPETNPPETQSGTDESKAPEGGDKKYEVVELTMWSMWSTGEPQDWREGEHRVQGPRREQGAVRFSGGQGEDRHHRRRLPAHRQHLPQHPGSHRHGQGRQL